MFVPQSRAPLGRALPYRRAAGEAPAANNQAATLHKRGWVVELGAGGLGDVLLALALVRGLAESSGKNRPIAYRGPLPGLFQRCRLKMDVEFAPQGHAISMRDETNRAAAQVLRAIPDRDPTWLDLVDEGMVEVHATLPMRYYLGLEQALGVRLPADAAPVPHFRSQTRLRPFHVVFVAATSWPERKGYGIARFVEVARALAERRSAPWSFTVVTGLGDKGGHYDGIEVLLGLDALSCLDVFASAQVVVGNDTGLNHLAALTETSDGSGPQVIGLCGRHAYSKWSTGNPRHHAIATPFSQMLAAADRCPVRDQLDDALWGAAADLGQIPPELVADWTGQLAGWW